MKTPNKNVKCDCGHTVKEHYRSGWCGANCGCTWYHPNHWWILRQQKQQTHSSETYFPPKHSTSIRTRHT